MSGFDTSVTRTRPADAQWKRKWNAIGTRMEREWNANGTQMEANGTQMERI